MAGAILVAAAPPAAAQGALFSRSAVFGTPGMDARSPAVMQPGCVDVFSEPVGVRPDTTAGVTIVDPMACDDEIPSEALDPGSGMVLVSAHGERLSAPQAPRPPAVAAWPAWLDRADPQAQGGGRSYPASTGNAARERVAVAINPPPSTRAPR